MQGQHPDAVVLDPLLVLRAVRWSLADVCKPNSDASNHRGSAGSIAIDEINYDSIAVQEAAVDIVTQNFSVGELDPVKRL